jgi:formylglycine-generating enzyme required for sulfatase activity
MQSLLSVKNNSTRPYRKLHRHAGNLKAMAALLALFGSGLLLPAAEPPHDLTLDLGNGVSLKAVLIPAGTFTMGSPPDKPQTAPPTEADKARHAHPNEMPQHQVTISKPFYLGIYPVTQAQFEALMGPYAPVDPVTHGTNHNLIVGPDYPVQPMSYDDITAFCQKLSAKTGRKVRLNTEAEFEYACRAGTQTTFFWGDDPTLGEDYGWYQKGESAHPHPVGQKKPNPWGLYDLGGNISEVCSDWGAHYPHPTEADYTAAPVTDPTGPPTGTQHVARGLQGWIGHSRSAGDRAFYFHPDGGDHFFGFRVVIEP